MPDQSVISMLDNSKNKLFHPTSTSLYGKNINAVEEWDSVTPPPYKVVGTVIRAPNTAHEIEEKVIPTMKKNDIVYNSGNSDKDKPYIRGIVEEPEESNSMISSKRDEMSNSDKTPAENIVIKRNFSACHFLNLNSTVTVTPEFKISASNTMNDTLKKIQDEFDHEKFVSNLRIIDLVEIFNALATFVAPTSFSELTSIAHYSSLSDNSTFKSSKDEFFDEVDAQSVTHFTGNTLDRTFSQTHRSEDKAEISRIRGREEHSNEKHSDDSKSNDDYITVKDEQDHKDFEKNSKLNPQMIPRSEFTKNDINEQESKIVNDCDVDHIDTSKEDSKQRKSANSGTSDETKLWELQNAMDEKYNEEDEKDGKSLVPVHFERTLWEKLVAGLKCSHRDCSEALRPTESVRRYLIEPSISRARKRSNGQL